MQASEIRSVQPLPGLRPYRDADMPALARLIWESGACPPVAPPTPKEIRFRWRKHSIDPLRDVVVLEERVGEIIAFMQAGLYRAGTPRLTFDLGVLPLARGNGIGSALLDLVVDRARRAGIEHITTPLYLPAGGERAADDHWLRSRDFTCEHSFWQMRLDGVQSVEAPRWPPGITCRHITDVDRDAPIWANLIVTAFGEHATAAGIIAQLAEPGANPEGYFFAIDERTGREIGTSRARIDDLGSVHTGYIGTVAVLPDYRGRGIATALLAQTMRYLAGKGIQRATLFVEAKNTGARRLYESLGWCYTYRTDHYWRRVLV